MAIASWPGLRSAERADRGDRKVGGVDLDDGEIGEGVDPVHLAGELAPVVQDDDQLGGIGDDMAVRHDPAVGVVDEPGAGAVGRAEQAAGRADGHDGGRHLVDGCR